MSEWDSAKTSAFDTFGTARPTCKANDFVFSWVNRDLPLEAFAEWFYSTVSFVSII